MDIKYYYEETSMTMQQIAAKLNISLNKVWKYTKKNYSSDYRKSRKVKNYSSSKTGLQNPMFGKIALAHHNFVGIVGDNKGYWMQLKPVWYTGRKHSKHVFVHHVVVCESLGITEIPKGWAVHHCDFNPENNNFSNLVLMKMGDHTKLHQSLKGATTISKESTLKWVETYGTPWRRDIVYSTQECVAASNVAESN
jgi:hypothetical protein